MAYTYKYIDAEAELGKLADEEERQHINDYRVAVFHEIEADLRGDNTWRVDAQGRQAEAAAALGHVPEVTQLQKDVTRDAVLEAMEREHLFAPADKQLLLEEKLTRQK